MVKKTYYLKNNSCYKAGRNIGKKKGIIVHSTGAVNKSLKRYIQPDDGILGKNKYENDWNQSGISKCVHAMIGEVSDGSVRVYETLPYNYACWGCGSGSKGSYNYSPNGHIQFEILEGEKSDTTYFKKAWKTAVEYCVWLCKTYGFDETDIVSHNEAHDKGYATNHGDADSYFKLFNKTMNDFRKEVRIRLVTHSSTTTSTTTNTSKPSSICFVKVNTSGTNLNCRKSANGSSAVIGSFKKGKELLLVQKTNKDWYKVKGIDSKGNLITGYCSTKYLKVTTNSSTVFIVNTNDGSGLNCRKSTTTDSSIIGTFGENQKVGLIAKTNKSWYKVKGMDKKGNVISGYCSANYLK